MSASLAIAPDRVRGAPVVFLLSSLTVGGSEAKTVRLANSLAQQNEPVIVAWLGGSESLLERLHPAVERVRLERRGRFSWHALRRLRALVARRRVGAIVAVNLYPTLYARGCSLLAAHRPRLIAALNTPELASLKERISLGLYRQTLRGFHCLIFGAESQRRLWHERHRIGTTTNCAVIYNGVDLERFARPAAPAALPATWGPGLFVAGTVAQLRPEKGHLTLLRAAALLRDRGTDLGLLIIGDGPERASIESEIARLGLQERVHLVGQVADVCPHLAAMQLFVLPSSVETFSNAALEAMASGLPVVSTRVGGMPEMLRHGGGLLVPPDDPEALATCMEDVAGDAALRERLARQARWIVERHFSWEAMVHQYRAQVFGPLTEGSPRLAVDRDA